MEMSLSKKCQLKSLMDALAFIAVIVLTMSLLGKVILIVIGLLPPILNGLGNATAPHICDARSTFCQPADHQPEDLHGDHAPETQLKDRAASTVSPTAGAATISATVRVPRP
jgi:hypothetical protein